MHHTINDTTIDAGQSCATVIADSIYNGKRITTLELLYPRYIHAELLTHRVLSRNASSSRATPISVLIQEARDPVFFDCIVKNKPGMQGDELLPQDELDEFHQSWVQLANHVADWVQEMSSKYDIHKQTLNRALEPFTRIRTLVTATDWDNFFKLRIDEAAQPEIRMLAQAMLLAMKNSTPKETPIHMPYVTEHSDFEVDKRISVARCARVSYGRLDGRPDDVADDIRLYHRLQSSGHMSPFEHVAIASNGRFANFNGWKSLRYDEENKE